MGAFDKTIKTVLKLLNFQLFVDLFCFAFFRSALPSLLSSGRANDDREVSKCFVDYIYRFDVSPKSTSFLPFIHLSAASERVTVFSFSLGHGLGGAVQWWLPPTPLSSELVNWKKTIFWGIIWLPGLFLSLQTDWRRDRRTDIGRSLRVIDLMGKYRTDVWFGRYSQVNIQRGTSYH